MAEEKNFKVGVCPKCGARNAYKLGDKSFHCNSCEEDIDVTEVEKGSSSSIDDANLKSLMANFVGYGSSDSSLVYVDSYLKIFDWDKYLSDTIVLIDELLEIANDAKKKHANECDTWLLEFNVIEKPLSKKIEYVNSLNEKIASKYFIDDGSEGVELFDLRNSIIKIINAQKNQILKVLRSDVDFAREFKLDDEKLHDMEERLSTLEEKLYSLVMYDDVSDMPEIRVKQEQIDNEIADEYLMKGIEAPEVYKKAVDLYNLEGEKYGCLLLFNKISKYKDSKKYIDKINQLYNFGQMYYTNGHYYTFGDFSKVVSKVEPASKQKAAPKKVAAKESKAAAPGCQGCGGPSSKKLNAQANKKSGSGCGSTGGTKQVKPLNVKELGKNEQAAVTPINKGSDLYEVTNGVFGSEPLVKYVSNIICVYGGKLYLVVYDDKKNSFKLCSYNFSTKELVTIDQGKPGENSPYLLNKKSYYTSDRSSFVFRKKLNVKEITKGCGKKSGGKGCFSKTTIDENTKLNKYEIVKVDMLTDTLTSIIPAAVDIYDFYDDKVFYQYRYKDGSREDKEVTYIDEFYVLDVSSNVKKQVLNRNCFIETVYNGNVIYTTIENSRSCLNLNLHSLSLENDKDTLLEENIYEFFKVINGKVYYKVGNKDVNTLFSVELNGENRLEIARNVSKFEFMNLGWLYFSKGYGYNKTLIKMSPDGKNRYTVCSLYDTLKDIIDGYLYYVDIYENLRMVRVDGTRDKLISTDVSPDDNIIVSDKVYFMRYEVKEYDTLNQPVYCASLYSVDLDGSNLRKVEFDIDNIKNFDEKEFFVSKSGNVRYKIGVPNEKGEYSYSYRNYNCESYILFKKDLSEKKKVMVLGAPRAKANEYQKGCMKKQKSYDFTYEEIPNEYVRVRKDVDESDNG